MKKYTLKIGEWLSTVDGVFEVVAFNEKAFCTLQEVTCGEDDSFPPYFLGEGKYYWTKQEVKRALFESTGVKYDFIEADGKNWQVEIQTRENGYWDADAVQDYIVAESEEEAIELAKDYLKECCIQNGKDPEQVDSWIFRATEK